MASAQTGSPGSSLREAGSAHAHRVFLETGLGPRTLNEAASFVASAVSEVAAGLCHAIKKSGRSRELGEWHSNIL